MPDIGRAKPCQGYGDQPCPRAAIVLTRHAKRCKSCSAKQRGLDYPWLKDYQMAKAREKSPNWKVHKAKQ